MVPGPGHALLIAMLDVSELSAMQLRSRGSPAKLAVPDRLTGPKPPRELRRVHEAWMNSGHAALSDRSTLLPGPEKSTTVNPEQLSNPQLRPVTGPGEKYQLPLLTPAQTDSLPAEVVTESWMGRHVDCLPDPADMEPDDSTPCGQTVTSHPDVNSAGGTAVQLQSHPNNALLKDRGLSQGGHRSVGEVLPLSGDMNQPDSDTSGLHMEAPSLIPKGDVPTSGPADTCVRLELPEGAAVSDIVPVQTADTTAPAAQKPAAVVETADMPCTDRHAQCLSPSVGASDQETDVPLCSPLSTPADVVDAIQKGYSTDPLYAAGNEEARSSKAITQQGSLFWKGDAVAVPADDALRRSIISELHASPYAGHGGMHRTQALVGRYFFWPGMRGAVQSFVEGCELCQRNKARTQGNFGKLQPLPVPQNIWEDISMDFVGPLPLTARKHDFILVVVDRLSKMVHFLPCRRTITAEQTAQIFADRIWSLHGAPRSIVTDRGVQFVNEFNATLMKLLGTRHCPSSAHHPQTDGQTERVNRVLQEMLRHYTNDRYDDWDMHLPLVEFAHNNAFNRATGLTPFYVCYGKHPRTPLDQVLEHAQAEIQADRSAGKHVVRASDWLKHKRQIISTAQSAMQSAQARMKAHEDKKRKELSFKVGDQVSLKTKHLGLSTLPSKKLFQPWLGPFTVSAVVNPVAYQLELPVHWRCHNVFHVCLLKPFRSNGEAVPPQSFTLTGGDDNVFEAEFIYDFGP